MTSFTSKAKSDAREAAAMWWARMSSDVKTSADQEAFDAWLAASPDHATAYAETCALAGRFDALGEQPEIAELRRETQLFEERQRRPLLARTGPVWAAASIAAVLIIATLLHSGFNPTETQKWVTARGESRNITLSDGSKVMLGSDSRLAIQFRRRQRDLTLERGQAFFNVARNADRPFVVAAAGRTITALGTAFDVRSYPNETTVTLLEGRVAIARASEGEQEFVLMPGQQLHVDSGMATVRDVDAAAETSWRTGVLEFDSVSLARAAMEFNRSAARSIIVSDPRLATLQVSGVFRADDPQGFAAALEPAYPLIATLQRSGDIVLTYREPEARVKMN